MKKKVAQILNDAADKLPLSFKVEQDYVEMTGKELKLTPVADQMELKDDSIYKVPLPKFVAVLHSQQLKDAYKRGGSTEVEKYINSIK